MANKKISQLPYIGVSKISGNTLVPLVTYFSGASGDTVHTYVSDLQAYIISGITGNTSVVGNYLPLSGGTVTGSTIFTNGLTANTISATTYQNLPQFSGGSGNCIADLFVSNIHSCSPLYINPLNEGDVYFGSVTSGVTFDISNSRIGIGTLSPQYTLDLKSSSSNLILNTSSTGNTLQLSGNTQLPRFGVIVSPYLTKPVAIGSMGIRAWNDSTYAGYGKVGDMHIYASSSSNGLNIINQGPGTSTDDYIRFYAGQDALGDDPDIHIQGSGSTRGYVGVGTKTPTERLDVSGKTKTINFQMTSGSTAGYVLTAIDSSGNARWQVSSGGSSTFTGGTVSGATSFTNGLSANTISATTYQNLPVSALTEGTNISITNTSGNHTISVTGITGGSTFTGGTVTGSTIFTNGLSATTVSATTYQNLPVSGITAGNNINVSGSSGNFIISFTGVTGGSTFTGGTVSGATNFTNGLTATTISATTYQNLPVSGLTAGSNINVSGVSGNFTISVTGITGNYLPISGGTVIGNTIFTSGLTASTISATTYQNLPLPAFFNFGTASTINWNISGRSNNYIATLTAATTLNVSNVRDGEYGTIILTQDSVGSRTITLGTINGTSGSGRHKVSSGGGGSIYLTSNPNAIDIVSFVYDGNILYWTVGNDYT